MFVEGFEFPELEVELTGATANDRQWLVGVVAHGNSMPKWRQAAVTVTENADFLLHGLALPLATLGRS